ncbi:M1 family metallopeptidase [Pseudemcibacter aquimaris]|uniref:M1 family metallopeptidase n=1 Tax=Pseudemcibacter aquimaris TaxID=2857064 RepID=UPI0020111366|nr:M1 family metallopeptidase [Pseudemcibacter aquimaris]MCC3859789.1 M1 family metallopeptidase [Pseudemcibacter aquimaris]WDU60183.1 M1 family metallopeptidase [Pseudemcibacter aquimaris]
MFRKLFVLLTLCVSFATVSTAQVQQTKGNYVDKFRQMDEIWPTANSYRTAGGEPGHEYWQQRADYKINVTMDEKNHRIDGNVEITYHNNSPDTLRFLWVQLDQNRFNKDSMQHKTATYSAPDSVKGFDGDPARLSLGQLRRMQLQEDREFGFEVSSVKQSGRDLKFTVVGTKMRVDLLTPLKTGENVTFDVDYAFNIIESDVMGGRGGYEHFPDDEIEGGGYLYEMSQWYPRMGAYTDYEAWTAKEFLGSGEFTQEFGDFDVTLTVPADHVVAATGELQNMTDVMTPTQLERWEEAKTAERPVYIVTPEEALENEKEGTNDTKTWHFKAENVRDFAWASSRKFAWDAKGYNQGGSVRPFVMAMSFFPKEGGELWEKYSTEVVIHTMEVYSRVSFEYPYPVAISVNGPVGGMEYPMITFNGPRTILNDDGTRTYTMAEKEFLIGVVIHEVGHFYFPMIVNSDERQWTWMDEGLNSYLDGVAGREWNYDWANSEPSDIIDYMKSQNQVPIMTQSDSVLRLGPNAYTKPATSLNILREVILGRELFDFAFKEYSRRWMFKRPTPSDFFRTMEEASGVDLDWFWRGWYYTTDHVDISLDHIYQMRMDTKDPDIDFARRRDEFNQKPKSLYVKRNEEEGMRSWIQRNPDVRDFHNENDQFTVTNKERNEYIDFLDGLEPRERAEFERAVEEDKNYYVLEFSNKGGLVMPILIEFTFTDGSTEFMNIPAEIWRRNHLKVKKLFVFDKEVERVELDPDWYTADTNVENNHYPRRIIPSRIEAYKSSPRGGLKRRNVMHDIKTELKEPKNENK